MSDEKTIKTKSRTAKLTNETLQGTKRGLKIGLAVGLGAGLFFAGAGVLFFGVGVGAAVTALAVSTVNTALIGTAVGAAYGALKGLFTSPRPKGDMGIDGNVKGSTAGLGLDEPQRSQSVSPELPDNKPVFANEAPAAAQAHGQTSEAHGQSSQADIQQLRQLTDQLNASRTQPADWQARVNRERTAVSQSGPAIG